LIFIIIFKKIFGSARLGYYISVTLKLVIDGFKCN